MISRMNRSRIRKVFAAVVLTVMLFVWLAESGVAYAATEDLYFDVNGERVYASLSGDVNGVTGKTSYTKGPGTVEVTVSGEARKQGGQETRGLVSMPAPVNTPGGVSTTMTPPSGYTLITAYSCHSATIGGKSDHRDITLFEIK